MSTGLVEHTEVGREAERDEALRGWGGRIDNGLYNAIKPTGLRCWPIPPLPPHSVSAQGTPTFVSRSPAVVLSSLAFLGTSHSLQQGTRSLFTLFFCIRPPSREPFCLSL